jgi:hypothetical protein
MKITYGDRTIKFEYAYLFFVVILFFTDGLFYDIIFGKAGGEDREGSYNPEKYITMFAFLVTIFFINKFQGSIRNLVLIVYLYMVILMLESYYWYGSFFVYPHVFGKIMAFFLITSGYLMFQGVDSKKLGNVILLIVTAFFVHAALVRPEVFTIGSFLATERGFAASSTYMLLLPCLFYLNKYFFNKKIASLLIFFAFAGIILFLQHRTVWLSTIAALIVNLLLLNKSNADIGIKSFVPIISIPLIAGFLMFSFVLSTNPEILEKFFNRVADIQNVESQGTGSWRLQQFQSYQPFIEDNLFIGMRFAGFELPIQFYQEENNKAYFEDGHGHHFHSFYVDKLFYLGLTGTLLLLIPHIYLIIRSLKKRHFSMEELVLFSFIASGIVYGFSYNWPAYFYGIIGISLSYFAKQQSEELA